MVTDEQLRTLLEIAELNTLAAYGKHKQLKSCDALAEHDAYIASLFDNEIAFIQKIKDQEGISFENR